MPLRLAPAEYCTSHVYRPPSWPRPPHEHCETEVCGSQNSMCCVGEVVETLGCCVAMSERARLVAGMTCWPMSQPAMAETGWPICTVTTSTDVHSRISYDESSVAYSTVPGWRTPDGWVKPSRTHASEQ